MGIIQNCNFWLIFGFLVHSHICVFCQLVMLLESADTEKQVIFLTQHQTSAGVCDVRTVQTFLVCLAVSWIRHGRCIVYAMHEQCRTLMLWILQPSEVSHGHLYMMQEQCWQILGAERWSYVFHSLLKSDMVAVCDVATVQNLDVICLAVSWSQTSLLYVMYQQCKTWMLCVSQSPEVRHGCRVWCINSAELGCYVSRSLEVKHGCCVWCIDSTEFWC